MMKYIITFIKLPSSISTVVLKPRKSNHLLIMITMDCMYFMVAHHYHKKSSTKTT